MFEINILNYFVGALGIIGSGALLFAATSFIGQTLLAPAGIGKIQNLKITLPCKHQLLFQA